MNIARLIIPSKQNKYHPVALRPSGLILLAFILFLLPFTYNVTAVNQPQVLGYATNISPGDLNSISNTQRANSGLAPLELNNLLSNAANAKANDMFAKNYWAHNSPSGATPWTFITGAGYSYSTAGENLAKNFDNSNGVVSGWMNSAGHRANILNGAYTNVGYAVVNGTLLGEQTTLVVAMYASPSIQVQPPPAPAQTSPNPNPPAAPQPETSTVAPQEVAPSTSPAPQAVAPSTSPAPQAVASTVKNQNQATPSPVQEASYVAKIGETLHEASTAPIKQYISLNWAQKTSLFLLCATLLLFVLKHTLVWRHQKRGFRQIWLRAHPLAQASILTMAIVVTMFSSTGVIL